MMKTLLLMRHAKSSWDDLTLADRERPLADRGRKDAAVIAKELVKRKLTPDLVLHSDAVRAAETYAAMRETLPSDLPARPMRSLYPGSPSRIAAVLNRLGDDIGTVLVISHSPGLATLARRLAAEGKKKERKRLTEKFPTAAVAVLTFDGWPDFDKETGSLELFFRPKDVA
ncbi:SixA phosphatase family protein [Marinivivus vitaminiproducens]|uniref:SixA phosphatase family protein n=1 Tax=Marinivivus vitaminiproducens TaxID=3035935 RepID=UPI0027A5F2ED|nr:histidine phosphatase family protein [Geminicoccaceae bacterium SCSIO 64248]